MKPTTAIRSAAQRLESVIGGTKRSLKAKLNLFEPVKIMPFKGYGTSETLTVMGRVLEQSGVTELDEETSVWRTFLNSIRRLDSNEIPGATLDLLFRGETWDHRCDHDGYFRLEMKPDGGVDPGWHEVEIELVDSMAGGGASATARVIVPDGDAELMVISDIDDTVIETGAMDTFRLMRSVLLRNAKQRRPFPGVVALYRALQLGVDRNHPNPVFYLSRSGWPLFDLFERVLELNDLPEGPLLLRDLSIVEKESTELGTEAHKLDHIRTLLELYDLPVVLIGDSGQHDPEIYREVLDEHDDRVAAVYIRHVVGAARAHEVELMYADHLPKLCVAPSTIEMARHAKGAGLISDEQLETIQHELTTDLKRK